MQRAIGLDREEVCHLDRADLGKAADVVAHEIDDHKVLGALLDVGSEDALGLRVGFQRG